jgi:hypothetical protein
MGDSGVSMVFIMALDGDDGVRVSFSKCSKQFEATGHDDDSDVDDVVDDSASDCAW